MSASMYTPPSGHSSQSAMANAASVRHLDDVPAAASRVLTTLLGHHRETVAAISPQITEFTDAITDFIQGGKRVRPTFAWAGYRCAGGSVSGPTADAAFTVCAALELIQACALIHDDIIDQSLTRRGRATVHRHFAAHHADCEWAGNSAHFGVSTAVLLGDMALSWADDVLLSAAIDETTRARVSAVWAAMRTEVLGGQLLDIISEARSDESVESAFTTMRYKTAGYTVTRPLILGAQLAGADTAVVEAFTIVGDHLGVAFQLQDDLLGAFGDPDKTGKPSGDDLMTGKRTALLAIALQRLDTDSPNDGATLRGLIGTAENHDDLTRTRDIIIASGAVTHIENHIDTLVSDATKVLHRAPIDSAARDELITLAHRIARRSQ